MKKSKNKMKLTIEMGDNGLIREMVTRSSDLTEEDEKKFWEIIKNSDNSWPFSKDQRMMFDLDMLDLQNKQYEVFHF